MELMHDRFLAAIFVSRWQWWAGGISLGLTVPAMYYFFNTPLGISTGYGNLVRILCPRVKSSWLNSDTFRDVWNWRLFFMAGVLAGGFLSSFMSGRTGVLVSMESFTGFIRMPFPVACLHMFSGGLLLGLGSRISGGCTSGHSIHGISNLHPSSMFITAVFVLFGVISSAFLRLFYGGPLP